MRLRSHRHSPFGLAGVVLIAIAVVPTAIGMLRGFRQLQRGEDAAAIGIGVGLAMHPAFVTCGILGIVLVVVAVALSLCGRPKSAP